MKQVLTVSELNHHIKYLMDQDYVLSHLMIEGELSNYKAYPSGHHYFSLKDAEGSIRCVMFRREASVLRFRPENGMRVVVGGRVTVFPRDGQYQLYCNQMQPIGLGDLHVAFEQIKAKLQLEGLFDPSHKKPIPAFPERIALITSPAGAAVRDMIRVLGMRFPAAKVYVVPVRVQGEEAKFELCTALSLVNQQKAADLIIIGRGGGSMEDLWAFNEEMVARAIFASHIPVISAVGHEPDITIADYVADLRAATPSNAAELAVPDQQELARHIHQRKLRLQRAMQHQLGEYRRSLERVERSPWMQAPLPILQESRHLLDYQQQKLARGLEASLAKQRKNLSALAASLDALSPLKVLGRGYSITQGTDGSVKRSISQVEKDEAIQIRLCDGKLLCRVERKEPF